MKTKLFFSMIIFLGMATFASAQNKTPGVTDRQINQQKRIVQGIKSGELTKFEVKQLEKQQKNIAITKKVMKSDGIVTKKERAILHKKQNNASKNIFVQKHDRQDRR